MNQRISENPLTSLAVRTKEGSVRVYQDGMVEINVSYGKRGTIDSEHARRTPRQWMDLLRASVSKEPFGTFCCPICGLDEPHGHDEITQLVERVARPAFESYMHRQHQAIGPISNFFKRGYYLGYPASDSRARKDGGWAERESPTGAYKSQELQAAWTLWLASWLAISERVQAAIHSLEKGAAGVALAILKVGVPENEKVVLAEEDDDD
jgi:hypothetical protein